MAALRITYAASRGRQLLNVCMQGLTCAGKGCLSYVEEVRPLIIMPQRVKYGRPVGPAACIGTCPLCDHNLQSL